MNTHYITGTGENGSSDSEPRRTSYHVIIDERYDNLDIDEDEYGREQTRDFSNGSYITFYDFEGMTRFLEAITGAGVRALIIEGCRYQLTKGRPKKLVTPWNEKISFTTIAASDDIDEDGSMDS